MPRELPAAEGGFPVRTDFLPFAKPSIGPEEIESVVRTLKSGWLTLGPRTAEFERVVAEYVGVDRAAAVSSCTAGLHLVMVALGVGPGDDVLVPALNFAAAPNMVIHVGAEPVLVDIDPGTLNVTAELLDAAWTEKTKLVIPLHFAGRPCRLTEIMELAASRGAIVLGDGAHALGAEYGTRKIGSVAYATSFSFYVTKGITTGEGGIVTSDDNDLLRRIGTLSLHGMSSDAWRRYSERGPWYYEILGAGYKYNMSDLQASIGLCQMKKIDEFRASRTRIAETYRDRFAELEGIATPPDYGDGLHAWHLYPIQIDPDRLSIGRDEFVHHLLEEGIGVSVHFIPIHYHPYYATRLDYKRGSFPATERYFERAISLPIYPSMSDRDVTDVTDAVARLHDYYKR
jgi:dTDP-4-amino-4,6-dideoxygalactose transaminase